MNFEFVEGVHGALHLDLTHNGHVPATEALYLKTNQFHMQQFTCDGDKHGADQMPIVVADKAGGAMKTGRTIDYSKNHNEDRRACSMYLSMMERWA
jgi:hypothetical protein